MVCALSLSRPNKKGKSDFYFCTKCVFCGSSSSSWSSYPILGETTKRPTKNKWDDGLMGSSSHLAINITWRISFMSSQLSGCLLQTNHVYLWWMVYHHPVQFQITVHTQSFIFSFWTIFFSSNMLPFCHCCKSSVSGDDHTYLFTWHDMKL